MAGCSSILVKLVFVARVRVGRGPDVVAATAYAATAATVPLVVYSAQGYDKAMATAFTKATGIPITLDDNSTGPLLTQIEASKNNPNWGLLWVDGATAFAGLDTQGLLMKGFEPKVTLELARRAVGAGRQELHADRRHADGGARLQQDQGRRTRRRPGSAAGRSGRARSG